ncbi:MAG: sigma-70 family RNA polymerase sigma factor [Chitinophagales bacterium]|nr:sigma-70 family RNA polymerase sigma factor [Chitinophagales bacterium]
MQQFTDEDIVSKLTSALEQEQDQALQYLYKHFYSMIAYYIKSNTGDEDDAKDLFQDTVLIFYNQVRTAHFQLSASVKTYLYSICRNLWLKKLRSRSTHDKYIETNVFNEFDDDAAGMIAADEKDKAIADLLNKLGESCKKILLCFYYEKLAMKEIVERMGFSGEQVAKNKKLKCMNELRALVMQNKNIADILRDN